MNGRKLKEMRKSRGYSIRALAKRSGLSVRSIIRWEHGETTPRALTLQALANALGVSYRDLTEGLEIVP
ncbi:MAG: helix-turn-helix domain-containing protein [Christensenellaceae bacterium]